MSTYTPATLLKQLDIQSFSLVTNDSRAMKPDGLFVAYQGIHLDGHRFIPQAIEKGAKAIIMERDHKVNLPSHLSAYIVPNGRQALAHLCAAWHDYPSRKLTLIGVTGTDGKTSTLNLIYTILKREGRKVGMINTVNAIIDDEVIDIGLHVTTPDSPDIQHYLAYMVRAGMEICLLEVTSHSLSQHRVDACDFDIAIVTNITHEHLDEHGSLEAYRQAKARLFQMAQRTVVLNRDDWSYNYLKTQLQGHLPILSYSLTQPADLRASQIQVRPHTTQFEVIIKGNEAGSKSYTVETPLIGHFNVSNCLAALAATVLGLEIDPQIALEAIGAFKGVPGRMERIEIGNPNQTFTAIVDFAHSPQSLRRALETVRNLINWQGQGCIIAIFGCAGLRDVEKRTLMGYVAAEFADVTIITAEDPRTEDLDMIIATTAQAMIEKNVVEISAASLLPYASTSSRSIPAPAFIRLPDRGRAIYLGIQLAQAGDIVIAFGKGHEQSMCFGTTEYPWDDREAMRTALRGRPLLTLPTANA